jgi:hypothetical protein
LKTTVTLGGGKVEVNKENDKDWVKESYKKKKMKTKETGGGKVEGYKEDDKEGMKVKDTRTEIK